MKPMLLAVAILFGSAAFGQTKPSPAQCEAEQRLWLVEYREWLGATDETKTAVNALRIDEILHRQIEMTDCETIVFNSKPGQSTDVVDAFVAVSDHYFTIAAERYSHFMLRHHLMQQMGEEDAAGAR